MTAIGGTRNAERDRIVDHACIGFALGLAWGLKDFYSRACFDDLQWVLGPTTSLVAWLTGVAFELESHTAYLSRSHRFAIVPACAGINFLIVVFCALACGLMPARRTLRGRLSWIAGCAVIAYAVTLLANAARIAIAMWMHEHGSSFGWLTSSRLHCAEGVAVYFLFLCVTYAIATRVTGAHRAPAH